MDSHIKNEEEKKEYFDSKEELELKIEQLALWIKDSHHFVAFTGAGISTGAGIADFRSGKNTVLETGPGIWEKKALHLTEKPKVSTDMLKAFPTKCHMSLLKLIDEGYLKYIISQNIDGLHRKSGIPPEKISELHGNTNIETCPKCKKEYLRDFRTRTAKTVKDHQTGRVCTVKDCGGMLNDSIINFTEALPEKAMDLAFYHSAISDLHLVMGSSLRVQPAASMPDDTVKKGGRLVIINLQKTPLDDVASMIIHAKIDDVIDLLMPKLKLTIPTWKITRRVLFQLDNEATLSVKAIDVDGTPHSTFKQINLNINGKVTENKKEPFVFKDKFSKEFILELIFHGYYDEPGLKLTLDPKNLNNKIYLLEYDPYTKKWDEVTALDYYFD